MINCMLEKISLTFSIKSSTQDEKIILNAVSKEQSNSEKLKKSREEDTFNSLVEQRIAEEKNKANLKKKVKKPDDMAGLYIPIYLYHPPVIEEQYLNRIRNSKKKRCSKCGDLFEPESNRDSSGQLSKKYICKSCMNKDIESFLTDNYL